ncbi:hypothetical protein FA95DRAFT_1551641 [Auriscalpium vulgare]|uniref:Uncharacterized protein n=1 Tax=Auriscalpium vulgare TaxID=40419 RepID=A0ACB8SD47_9AGAM|nr:hypothetical protein FA95DRAFT_1551641 [Auriscalpium vulgare]
MAEDVGHSARRLPSLVQLCVKVAIFHAESISSLGHSVPYELVRPILESCTAETLHRLESSSPHLKKDTNDLWRHHCLRTYPLPSEPYANGSLVDPHSWREQFYYFRDLEAKRFEAIGSRLKIQRLEAEERKKEKEVKLTDRVPPMKRGRGWNTVSQPKTLIQRTRTEATKIQRSVFGVNLRPSMLAAKSYRVVTNSQSAKLPAPPSAKSSSGSRVVVKQVTHRAPATPQASPPKALVPGPARKADDSDAAHAKPCPISSLVPSVSVPARPSPPGGNAKKGPTSSLFMPKHRAYSQLPTRTISSRVSTTK